MKSVHQINRIVLIVFILSLAHVILVDSQDRNRPSTGGISKDSSSNRWNSAEKTTEEDSNSSENQEDDDDDDDDEDEERDGDDDEDEDEDDHDGSRTEHGRVDAQAFPALVADSDAKGPRREEPDGHAFETVGHGSQVDDAGAAGQHTVSIEESETPKQSEVADGNFPKKNDEKTLFVAVGVAFSVVIVLAAVLLFAITAWRRRRQKTRNGPNHLTASMRESIEFETIPTCGTLDENGAAASRAPSSLGLPPPGYEEATRTR